MYFDVILVMNEVVDVNISKRPRVEDTPSPYTPEGFCCITSSASDVNTSSESSSAPEFAFSRAFLDEVGLCARMSLTSQNRLWMEKFLALLDFGKEHGHCNVPCSYECTLPNGAKTWLGEWLCRQRRSFKLNHLSAERTHFLQILMNHELLSWNNLRIENANALWIAKYQCLLEYIEEHGDGNVPWNYLHYNAHHDPVHLGEWVSRQRRDKKLDHLSPEHLQLLQSLADRGAFVWTTRQSTSDKIWETRYQALLQYGDLNGHCNVRATEVVIMGDGSQVTLGKWLAAQKRLWKVNGLCDAKYSKLQRLVDAGLLQWKV